MEARWIARHGGEMGAMHGDKDLDGGTMGAMHGDKNLDGVIGRAGLQHAGCQCALQARCVGQTGKPRAFGDCASKLANTQVARVHYRPICWTGFDKLHTLGGWARWSANTQVASVHYRLVCWADGQMIALGDWARRLANTQVASVHYRPVC
eukprot:scaffold135699_cov22-Tisochrysis_lutea.AAC.1